MATYRSPEERRENYNHRVRAYQLIEEARTNLTSWCASELVGTDADTGELWVTKIWNELRAHDTDDLIQAIICLIEDDCNHDARVLVDDCDLP